MEHACNGCLRQCDPLTQYCRKPGRGCSIPCRVILGVVAILVFFAVASIITLAVLGLGNGHTQCTELHDDATRTFRKFILPFQTPPIPSARRFLITLGDDFGGLEKSLAFPMGMPIASEDAHRIEGVGDSGELAGMNLELIYLVCAEAGIDCEPVFSNYTECWFTNKDGISWGGRGLRVGWFDGCIGYYRTQTRMAVFDQSVAYLERDHGYFFFKLGTEFDQFNIRHKRIGFLRGWAFDVTCIRRKTDIAGSDIPTSLVKTYDETKMAVEAIENGEIDALFSAYNGVWKYIKTKNLAYSQLPLNCILEGSGLMTRRGSPLIPLWNMGFQKARANGKFRQLCLKSRKLHFHYGLHTCIDEDVLS